MGKSKSGTNIFAIIFKSLMIYINNFLPLSRVMLFPVFGQIIGIFLIFYPNYLYTEKYLAKLSGENLEQNLVFILLGLILMVIPGFAVFLKAFWDYMIVMISLNPMVSDIEKKGSFGDFKVYNSSVKLKTNNYVILLLLMTLFWLGILIFPFLSFFLGFFINTVLITPIFLLMVLASLIFSILLSVNLSLVFQVFAFESISPVEVIKKSWNLMKGNFWRTTFMGIVLLVVTCFIVPGLITAILDKSPLMTHLINSFEAYVNLFAKNQAFVEFLASYKMTPFGLSVTLAVSTVGTIITAMMLPWGSACFTLLYFDILGRKR
ncbi:MAG: hypothetical protein A2039_10085 [Candidatus Melainabacteria bacterium GWA2_34_9]|nr:MAG: hypothetical protein A2039_10085 [Candidatus Melainabacteria bacterium GWA2_34_9]